MANKKTTHNVGDTVEFIFLGERQSGVVDAVNSDYLLVKNNKGRLYHVHLSDKDSKFCYLI